VQPLLEMAGADPGPGAVQHPVAVGADQSEVGQSRCGGSGLGEWQDVVGLAVAEPTVAGRLIAAWPSFALIAAYELLMRQVRCSAAGGRLSKRSSDPSSPGGRARPERTGALGRDLQRQGVAMGAGQPRG
jgi:hypothetical protein